MQLGITVENGMFYYQKNKVILNNVNLKINEGITNVIGTNGSGKSTLIKIFSGLLSLKSGKVSRTGNIAIISDYVSLPTDVLIKSFLSDKIFDFLLKYLPNHYDFVRENSHRKIKELSTGQKRLYEIVLSIAAGNEILLCDEITNGLDYINAQLIIALLNQLATMGYVIIFITHHLEEYMLVSSKKNIFIDGKTGMVREEFLERKEDIIKLYMGAGEE